VIVIVLPDFCAENLVDDRHEVGERTNGREGWRVAGSRQTASGGKDQCVEHSGERDSALVELFGEHSVATSHKPAGVGRCAIGSEELADVFVAL